MLEYSRPLSQPLNLIACTPPHWARDAHGQTLLGHLIPSPRLMAKGELISIPLKDGDWLVGDYFGGTSAWIVLLFHGLGGHARADYMERTAMVLARRGHSVCLINHRGCGEGKGKARQIYHSGRGEDVSDAISYWKKRSPEKRVLAIGFSLGGSALLNLLTGRRGTLLPDAAITVNAPLDLDLASRRLQQGMNRIYDLRFSGLLMLALRQRKQAGLLGDHKIPFVLSVRDFDERFTPRYENFADRDDYYRTCSAGPYLSRIQTPTLLLTSEDDPFVPVSSYHEAKLSPATQLHIEKIGGHMGYLCQTRDLGTRRWLDYALDQATACLIRG